MKYRAFALRAMMIGIVGAMIPACFCVPPATCTAANCDGCCSVSLTDLTGTCVKKPNNGNNTTCGSAAGTCSNCTLLGQVCDSSGTAPSFTCLGTGGSGGGSTGGGGGTAVGGGTATGGGGGIACSGCLAGTTCVNASMSGSSVVSCGLGGIACVTCMAGQLCVTGVCTTPMVDGGTGRIGEACTVDADCRNVPAMTGFRAFCKKVQNGPAATPYDKGYCTRRCFPAQTAPQENSCGAGAVCQWFYGIAGERDNICYQTCATASDCRANYECTQIFSNSPLVCLPVDLVIPSDAGAPTTVPTGSACTTDSDCGSTSSFACIPALRPDGGLTGFTGGFCTGDCTLRGATALGDAFCGGGNSNCGPRRGGLDVIPARGETIVWECNQSCMAGIFAPNQGEGGCREGYVCSRQTEDCIRDCRFPGNTCASIAGANTACNAFNGQCETACNATSCGADGGTCTAPDAGLALVCAKNTDCRLPGNTCPGIPLPDGGSLPTTCHALGGTCFLSITIDAGTDAGTFVDAGTDSGTVVVDAGSDAGTTLTDSGTSDAGDGG